ncbi:MAG: hypothetical protein FWE93_05220 [Alphaproteobacteria bacterium]|nr:hypothetical protein [Alphaproteobacteria bacterium]
MLIVALGLTLITSSAMAEEKSLCKVGTVANLVQSGTTWTWTCEGIHGGKSKSCAPKINGKCGTANGVATATAPTTTRCSAGTAGTVTTNATTFTWSCAGINGGNDANCSAPKLNPVNGVCRAVSGQNPGCSAGAMSGVTMNIGTASWNCLGSNGGSNANCSCRCTCSTPNPSCPQGWNCCY